MFDMGITFGKDLNLGAARRPFRALPAIRGLLLTAFPPRESMGCAWNT